MASNLLQQAAEAKVELLRRSAWNDLYVFTKYVCGREQMADGTHRELCEFLTAGLEATATLNLNFKPPYSTEFVKNDIQRLLRKLTMLPRGSFKSTVATNAFPIWLLWHNPNLRILIDSETLGNAKLYLAGIKDMIENNHMLKMICIDENGEYVLEPNKAIAGGFTEEQLILKKRTKTGMKEPSVFCAGVDNARTGMHPDVIIMDDLVSERNVNTPDQIEKTKNHYRYSLSLLEPGGLHLVIGTRYHMADLYGELISLGTFDTLIRPAILPDGRLYFPERLTQQFLDDQRKEQGSYIYSCQYMLSPIDESTSTFKKQNIQYFIGDAPGIVAKYITIDLAISQKDTADYFVCMCTGATANNQLYVLDYERKRCKPDEQISTIFSMFAKQDTPSCRVKAVGIETVAYQKALFYLIQNEMRRTGTYMPLKELKADRDKIRRAQALQPMFENHDVFIRPNHFELEQELLEFPFSKHDDTVDCLAYVPSLLRPGGIVANKLKYAFKPKTPYTNY